MIRRAPHRMRGTSGTAAVEFALVLPMLLALLIGTVEVGFLILSHASMNATMARVPDLVRRARDLADMSAQLDALAEMQLGLGLADMTLERVAEECICPADAPRFLMEHAARLRDCPISCGTGVDALRFYTVEWQIAVPSLIPRDDIGVRRTHAQLIVMRP